MRTHSIVVNSIVGYNGRQGEAVDDYVDDYGCFYCSVLSSV